jgi:hypothetical protein
MGGFIIRLAPQTSFRLKDEQIVVERKHLEVAVSMPMSTSSSVRSHLLSIPAEHANSNLTSWLWVGIVYVLNQCLLLA